MLNLVVRKVTARLFNAYDRVWLVDIYQFLPFMRDIADMYLPFFHRHWDYTNTTFRKQSAFETSCLCNQSRWKKVQIYIRNFTHVTPLFRFSFRSPSLFYLLVHSRCRGFVSWRSWLRHGATNRQVAGSIPDGVSGFFSLA
jgi:hypothetical protein